MSDYSVVAVELVALGADVRTPFREALRSGKPLVVTLGGEPQIVVESLEDFEVIQTLIDAIADSASGQG